VHRVSSPSVIPLYKLLYAGVELKKPMVVVVADKRPSLTQEQSAVETLTVF
jgi:hypothetical protein